MLGYLHGLYLAEGLLIMKSSRLNGALIALVAMQALSGCMTKKHYSDAVLYEPKPSDANQMIYVASDMSSNPIYVTKNSSFKLEIDYIRPGWMHQGKAFKAPNLESKDWGRKKVNHFYGKELWLLTKIESLSSNDVFERDSKIYYKFTNVKLNSASFLKVALDSDEKTVFAHTADGSYRVTMRLYEVDGFRMKQFILNAYDENPGLFDIIKGGGEMILSTLNSAVGSQASSFISGLLGYSVKDKSAIERILMKNNATIEMSATFHILRSADGKTEPGKISSKNFILYDKLKSEPDKYSVDNMGEYSQRLDAMHAAELNIDRVPSCRDKKVVAGCVFDTRSFIKLKLTEYVPVPDQNKGARDPLPMDVQAFMKGYKPD